jgi:hypothetical protein
MTHPTPESALRLARAVIDYGRTEHIDSDPDWHSRAEAAMKAIDAALAAADAQAADPEARPGWKLVPVEPTERMLQEVEHAARLGGIWTAASVYRAMLAAAPTPEPAEARQDEADFEVYVMHDDEVEHYASTYGPRARALAEAMHYAQQATGDGIAEVVEIVKRRVWIDPRAVHPTPDAAGEPQESK